MTPLPESGDRPSAAPHVLVVFASKHGSTREIAEVIGEVLKEADLLVDVLPARQVVAVDRYDAVVIGSAVYVGRWMVDARKFVERRILELARRPVWLFSSGPVDDSASTGDVPPVRSVAAVAQRLLARGHVTFGGRVGAEMSGPTERWVIRGDWRDFDAVRRWAAGIGEEISRICPSPISTRPIPDVRDGLWYEGR